MRTNYSKKEQAEEGARLPQQPDTHRGMARTEDAEVAGVVRAEP